jgi:hypothetical protein
MRKLSQLGLLVALFFSLTQAAQASLLVEPLIGYNFNGKLGTDASRGSGTSYGGRLGYQNMGFQLGLDYLNSTMDYGRGWGNNADFTSNEYGIFVGYKFPILVRVYAAYIFSANGEVGSYELSEGSGTKIGAGFTGLPFVNINLEYRRGTFGKSQVSGQAANNSANVDFSALLLSLSLPLNF